MRILLIAVLLVGCGQKMAQLKGEWVGNYEDDEIRLIFSDDTLTILYQKSKTKVVKSYSVENDKLFLSPEVFDTCRIEKLDEKVLSLRPINDIQEDVNIIFLIDFVRVN